MTRFLAQRLGFGALVLLVLSSFVFVLFFVAPGDPARMIAGDKATETQLQQIRTNLGVDRPMVEQYTRFLGRALTGDLGYSYRNRQPVAQIILRRIPATLSLVAGAVLLWLAIGIPIGLMSARHPGALRDRMGQGFILIGLSFPTFVLGMMSLYLLYFLPRQAGFTLFPAGGYKPISRDPLLWAWHMALPWTTLALTMAAFYARLTRGQMLEVMGEDYIRTARAKGLSERRVVWKHGMRAALTPLVTQLGADIALLLGGAIVIEQVYGLQGVGALAVQAVNNQDRPIIIGVVLLGGVFIVAANIVVDLFYVLLDPRVR
jgi:peptide/nickel transport system permease protein